jgi:hypothetical protein
LFNIMDNPRREYIRLLSLVASEQTPEPGEKRDATLLGELTEAKHLRGSPLDDRQGFIRAAAPRGMTVSGRLFLQQLKREEKQASPWGQFKAWGFPLLTYAAGVLTPIFVDLLRAWLGLAH